MLKVVLHGNAVAAGYMDRQGSCIAAAVSLPLQEAGQQLQDGCGRAVRVQNDTESCLPTKPMEVITQKTKLHSSQQTNGRLSAAPLIVEWLSADLSRCLLLPNIVVG